MPLISRLKGKLRVTVGALGGVLLLSVAGSAAPETSALDAGSSVIRDAGGDLDAGADAVASLADPRTARIRALIDGGLAVSVEPQSLFDVPLADESAIQVEAVRLRRLLRPEPPAQPSARATGAKARAAAPSFAPGDSGVQVDPALVQSRDALDRARLDFYSLSLDRRLQLLVQHAASQAAARPKETEAERAAREAEQERQKALEAAREARSEAERSVAKELARLIGVESRVGLVRQEFIRERGALATRRESLLGWRQRVHEAQIGPAAEADATYDALRKTLRVSRIDLASALATADSGESSVPDAGPDALKDVPPDISTAEARKRREALARIIAAARADERSLRQERAATLLDEITALNGNRLELLASLSGKKRAAITGFTAVGLDQARSEIRQLLLILRYHEHVLVSWLSEVRRPGSLHGVSWWRVLLAGVPWFAVLLALVWWRRRSPKVLALAEKRAAELDRSERRTTPGPLSQIVRVLRGVHRPMEWLLFLGLLLELLPASAEALLEVQLLVVIAGYSFGGALMVNLINSLALLNDAPGAHATSDFALLRLRSLRLVGRVVVIFALVLVVSSRLVGTGTLYRWVWSFCWLAALSVFLLLVRWWRETVFLRVERVRRKSATQSWILANRSGWKSFFAAMIAAVQMFSVGGYKAIRNWVTSFDLVRRAHAYLFKRGLTRLTAGKSVRPRESLNESAAASLSPDRQSAGWVPCPADARSRALRERASSGEGGLVVLVGARGQGKTTVLRWLAEQLPEAKHLQCRPTWSVDDLRAAVGPDAADSSVPNVVLVDDAQVLLKPIQGGLRALDDTLSFARTRSDRSLWVFALDASLWPFLQRARDSRLLFDQIIRLEPWNDEQIGALLTLRNDEAGIVPTFEDLLDKLSPAADEVDKQEALDAKRVGYFRMIWDYARGNPGLALEVWRWSLAQDSEGDVRVRPLVTPDDAALEQLPDVGLFIIRAILQMGPASSADVARATRLEEVQIDSAFRFGCARGYLHAEGGRVRVTWRWLRPVMALLERRQLLVDS